MLFAIKYQSRPGRTEAESKRARELLMAWEPPTVVEIRHHFHYVSGGGVVIADTEVLAGLYESMAPFKSLVDFDVEPVVNVIEALAISLDVDEWAASVKDGSRA